MVSSDVNQIGTVVKYEILKYLRGRRLLILVVLILLINGLFLAIPPAIGSAYPKTSTEFTSNMLTFIGFFMIISATFFGADAIVSEFEQKTGYFFFPNPIKRITIFAGKYIASALVALGGLALYYIIVVVSAQIITGSIAANVGLSFLYACLYMLAILGLAYLFSAFMKQSVSSLVLTFFTLFLILPIIDGVGAIAKFKPWFSVTFAAGIVTDILQQPYPTDTAITVPTGSTVGNASAAAGQSLALASYYPEVNVSLIVMVAYLVVTLVLSYFIMRRREM